MKRLLIISAVLFSGLFIASSNASAQKPWEIQGEIWEGNREIRREYREGLREIRNADSWEEAQDERREMRREIRQERREKRREVRREVREPWWW